MSTQTEFFVLNFNTLEEMANELNNKCDYYDDGIEIITQELANEKREGDDRIYYNFLC